MPYDSASGAYIRRTTTVLDETPDGDTVNTAVAVKLDTVGDDATADLNHHRVQGGHYPAPSVSNVSRYLKQTPAGDVTWGDGVPIEQAAVKDLSNVPAGTTAGINITGNAATASDMAAGHVLAGKTTAEAVRGALSVPTRDLGDLSQAGTTRAANCAMPGARYIDYYAENYTAPADGYIVFRYAVVANTYGWLQLICGPLTAYSITPQINEVSVLSLSLPIQKGHQANISAYGGSVHQLRFIYAEGAY